MDLLMLFAAGTIWFWILMTVWSVIMFAAVENDRGGFATISLIATLLLLQFLGNIKVLTFVAEQPLSLLAGLAGYFLCGTLWSVGKWWFFVKRQRAAYDEERRRFLTERGLLFDTPMPDHLLAEWLNRINTFSLALHCFPPRASQQKGRILAWMCYWPWSLVWTIISDPVKDAFEAIYLQLQRAYQHISESAFADTELNDSHRKTKQEK